MCVAVTVQVRQGHEGRKRPGERGLDLSPVLPKLGLDEGEIQEGVRLALRRERPELGVRPREWLAVLAQAHVALLRERPTPCAFSASHPLGVDLYAREVDHVQS